MTLPAKPISSPKWGRSVGLAVSASAVYTMVVYGYLAHPSSQYSVPEPLWLRFGWDVFLACGTIGVPIVLWIHYGRKTPFVIMCCILMFWHIGLPVLTSLSGKALDIGGFSFVFMLAPLHVILYLLAAQLERDFRNSLFRILDESL